MAYRYVCRTCQARGPRGGWGDARAERDDHRERAHHGLRPDDAIQHEPGLLARAAGELARGEGPVRFRGTGGHPAVRQAGLLLAAGVVVVILLALIIH